VAWGVVFFSFVSAAESQTYRLANEYVSLAGEGGSFSKLRIDPYGKGEYGPNLIRDWRIGAPTEHPLSLRLEENKNELIFHELGVNIPVEVKQETIGYPLEIEEGKTV